jgi:hypothetical protein
MAKVVRKVIIFKVCTQMSVMQRATIGHILYAYVPAYCPYSCGS